MPRTIKIVWSGTDIDLLDTSGFIAQRGGFGKTRFRTRMDIEEGAFGANSRLRSTRVPLITERYRLNLLGASHNDAATTMQALHQALLEAERFYTTQWQTQAVYLEVQTTNETSIRYARIYGSPQLVTPDFFDQPFESSNEIENVEVQITREPYWRGTAPSVLPAGIALTGVQAGTAITDVEQFVQLAFNDWAINSIFVDDGGVFGSNLRGATDFDLLPTVPAVGDAVYFGEANVPWHTLMFNLSTLAVDVTGVWEIWTGAAWSSSVETVDGADGTNDFKGFASQVGKYAMYLGDTGNWAKTTVNTRNEYWLRFRVTAVGASPAPPHQASTDEVDMGNKNYVEIPATAIDGDADALMRMWISKKVDSAVGAAANAYGQIIVGMKTRHLGNDHGYLPLGLASTGMPTGVTGSAGTDTATFTNGNFTRRTIARCTFTSVQTVLPRWTLSFPDAQAENWRGSWQVYFLGYQTLGAAKDVEVELGWSVSGLDTIFNGLVPMQRVETDADDEMAEVINLGRIDIPPVVETRSLAAGGVPSLTGISLAVRALSNGGSTPNLHMCALVMIPIDELALHITRPDVAQGTDVYALTPDRGVILDGGIVGEGVDLLAFGSTDAGALNSSAMQWMLRSDLPKLPPDKAIRLYFLPIDSRDPTATAALQVGSHAGFYVRIWTHERWHSLRGAD